MKIYFVSLFSLIFFLSGCATAPMSTPLSVVDATQVPVVATPAVPTATVTLSPSPAITPPIPTPTFISAPLPNDLSVAYVVEDELWIWKQNDSQMLLRQKNISAPDLSDDGQWILFKQTQSFPDNPSDELWAVRIDGGELHRLLDPRSLTALIDEEVPAFIYEISWFPNRNEILFSLEKISPPGRWPLLDLYLLDLSGKVTQLIEPGMGGKFIPSPDGINIALVTNSRIDVLNLDNGKQRTLFEFEHLWIPSDSGSPIPKVVWDPQGRFVMTAILPQKLYYAEYAGEPTQIWRLFVNGQTELITELQPFVPAPGITFSPNLQHFFYLYNSCIDRMGMLNVYSMDSAEEYPLSCVWELPQWVPDGEHFIYEYEGLWQLGSIFDTGSRPLDFLNVPADPNVHAYPQLTWINDEYFLLVLRGENICTLSIATLQGIVTQIASTPPDICPRGVNFSIHQ